MTTAGDAATEEEVVGWGRVSSLARTATLAIKPVEEFGWTLGQD